MEPQTLAPIFNYGSQHTDIQRENVEKVIKNQYIEWCVYVYEVSKISSNPPSYRVIVSGDTRQPSCIITLYPRDQFGIEEIETSQTGSRICIRGKIIGIGPLRSILIDPASSWCNAFN